MVYFLAALCGYWYVRRYLKAAYGFYAFSPSMGLGPAESLFRFSIFLAAACAIVNSRRRSIGIAVSFPAVSASGRFCDRGDSSKVSAYLSYMRQALNFFLISRGSFACGEGLAAHPPAAMCSKRHTYYPKMGHLYNKIMAACPAAGKTPGSCNICDLRSSADMSRHFNKEMLCWQK